MIYAPFPQLRVVWVFCRFWIYKLKYMWLEDVLRRWRLKKKAKERPKRTQYWWSKAKSAVQGERPKRSGVGKRDQYVQRLPRSARGGCCGWTLVVCTTMVCASSLSRAVFLRGFLPFHMICRFCQLLRWMYLAEKEDPIPLNTTSIPEFSISFKGSFREKEGKAKIAKIPNRVCGRKIQARYWLSFLSLLFSFLNLVLCFVIFNLNIVVWSWFYCEF